jgi:predicted nucleic acid-binding protein
MYERVFLDANVLVDVYDLNRPFSEASKKALFSLLQDKSVALFTSCDIITTIYYLRAKENREKALDDIININAFCHIIEFGNTEVTKSCRLMKQNHKFTDLEDTIQYVMAKKIEADLILSNDANFVSDGIELMNTEQFCEKYL